MSDLSTCTTVLFNISQEKIKPEVLSAELYLDESLGGIVIFEGRVRNHSAGKKVLKLEYEAYRELALSEGRKILQEAFEQFAQVKRIICVHAHGELKPGELAVFVGAAAEHRDEAFQACRYVVEGVKHRLPIWKKETFESGESHWVNCQEHHAISR